LDCDILEVPAIAEISGDKLKKSDFSDWYNELLTDAEIMDVRYPVKGLYAWFPFGFTIRKHTFNLLRSLLDKEHVESYFPMLIPENELLKESEHIKGFEKEVFWVTRGGSNELDIPLALRPTSETAIYPMYSIWIRSHADLPLKIYQVVNTFRYETKHTRPLIRLREISSFKEAHTAHATWEEAKGQTEKAVKLYSEFYYRLGVPHVITRRPAWDKFPGADYTLAFDTLMPDGKTLQIGTIHHLGTNFSKTFDITYEDINGEQQYVNQTCYGISERCIAAVISIHGDDKGLVLPHEIAPIQIIIIPIIMKAADSGSILAACYDVQNQLSEYRIQIDVADERPGAKYFKWERKGVPIRIEIGPRDLKNNCVTVVRRDTGAKETVTRAELLSRIPDLMAEILFNLRANAQHVLESHIIELENPEDAKNTKGIFKVSWCGSEACGHKLEEFAEAEILGEITELKKGKCPVCRAETEIVILMSRPY
jgi:prolyl-tRNA synthetase